MENHPKLQEFDRRHVIAAGALIAISVVCNIGAIVVVVLAVLRIVLKGF